ncbi:MAG TPA: HPr family phosphocarrier protein [Eubacteriaceae bacterium]|nr:HPr family phosphocarrier protein [Eubacteriaceae bacterium]
MISKEVILKNKTTLHARSASNFVQLANNYKSEIYIQKGNTKIDAKSIIGVLTLGASEGAKITIIADGKDEEEAVKVLSELIESENVGY